MANLTWDSEWRKVSQAKLYVHVVYALTAYRTPSNDNSSIRVNSNDEWIPIRNWKLCDNNNNLCSRHMGDELTLLLNFVSVISRKINEKFILNQSNVKCKLQSRNEYECINIHLRSQWTERNGRKKNVLANRVAAGRRNTLIGNVIRSVISTELTQTLCDEQQ